MSVFRSFLSHPDKVPVKKCRSDLLKNPIGLGSRSGPRQELYLLKAALLNLADSSFSRGHVSGSINVPFSSALGPDGEIVQCPATGVLQNYKGRVIVVISHAMKSAAMVRMLKHTHFLGGF